MHGVCDGASNSIDLHQGMRIGERALGRFEAIQCPAVDDQPSSRSLVARIYCKATRRVCQILQKRDKLILKVHYYRLGLLDLVPPDGLLDRAALQSLTLFFDTALRFSGKQLQTDKEW